ncbi:hypothetical protein IMSAG192_00537 [Muribaculaceae bacterium]|nr:hypothetical protein IMSAG192_00537 [Muribaculaceae bacterium]
MALFSGMAEMDTVISAQSDAHDIMAVTAIAARLKL